MASSLLAAVVLLASAEPARALFGVPALGAPPRAPAELPPGAWQPLPAARLRAAHGPRSVPPSSPERAIASWRCAGGLAVRLWSVFQTL